VAILVDIATEPEELINAGRGKNNDLPDIV
jgi:hypothetical protein